MTEYLLESTSGAKGLIDRVVVVVVFSCTNAMSQVAVLEQTNRLTDVALAIDDKGVARLPRTATTHGEGDGEGGARWLTTVGVGDLDVLQIVVNGARTIDDHVCVESECMRLAEEAKCSRTIQSDTQSWSGPAARGVDEAGDFVVVGEVIPVARNVTRLRV